MGDGLPPPPIVGVPTLRELAEWHSYNGVPHPRFAHGSAAVVATAFGSLLGAGRAVFFAMTCPLAERAAGFAFAFRGAAPMYIIPFVIGAQWDLLEASWARRGQRRRSIEPHAAGHLG